MAAAMRLLILAWLFRTTVADCRHSDNCEDCVSNKSWNGKPCRWCPRDNACHAYGSLLNSCKRAENIVDKSGCGSKLSQYVPRLSYKMLLLSSVAYDKHDPQGCVNKALPSSQVKLRKVITRECDLLGNKCSAYLATSDVEKAIIVAFRGSEDFGQALQVFLEGIGTPKTDFLGGEVQNYWYRAFKILWGCMEVDIKALHSEYPEHQIWVTGHSLGGAIASLASTWLAYYNVVPRKNIVLYTFGMPRVGNYDHAFEHDRLVKNSWRVVNYRDLVPHFPSVASVSILNGPYHHGVEAYYTETATSVDSNHKECHGKPYNEDKGCSFTTFPYSLENHKEYFSIPVGTYCSSISRKKRDTSATEFEFTKDHCAVYKYKNGTYVELRNKSPVTSSGKQSVTPDKKVALIVNIMAAMKLL